ncbi:MAG: cell division protein FtsA [Patescibacteria group bacterium]
MKTLTAIDIGTTKITILMTAFEDQGKMKIVGHATSNSKGVKKGVIVDIDQIIESIDEALQKAERMAGVSAKNVVTSVGGPHITSQDSHGVVAVANPRGDIVATDIERVIDAAKAISIPATRYVLTVSPRQFVVDGQSEIRNPMGMSGVRLEVDCNIITASSTNLRNMERVLESLELYNEGFVFSAAASAYSTTSEAEREMGVLVVDVGGGKTDYAVFSDNALCYASSIPIGAKHITGDLAVGLGLPLDTAEEMKMYLSNAYVPTHSSKKAVELPDISQYLARGDASDYTAKTVYEGIISVRLEEMFQMITKDLEEHRYNKLIPAGVVLTGGGARTIGIQEIAKSYLHVPVRTGSPFTPGTMLHSTLISGVTTEMQDPSYSTVAGLLIAFGMNLTKNKSTNLMDFMQSSIDSIKTVTKSNGQSQIFQKIKDIFRQFLP